MSGPYGLYMCALETCLCSEDMCLLLRQGICCLDRVYAVWTWYMLLDMVYALGTGYMLLGQGICSMEMSSCWMRIYGYGRCMLVGEEYMNMEDVFLLDKSIWICKRSSCWIRIYGYGRCLLFLFLFLLRCL